MNKMYYKSPTNSIIYKTGNDTNSKKLLLSYKEWLEELPDSVFTLLTESLQSLHYSLYDCMYCHNYLSFLPKEETCEGVNILLFDNEEMICSLQHHFVRHSSSNKICSVLRK